MRLLECEYYARKRSVERYGKSRARAARNLISALHIRTADKLVYRAAARAAEKHTRSFRACVESAKHTVQACRRHCGKHLIPFHTKQSARSALRLGNAASAYHRHKMYKRAYGKRAYCKHQKQQGNKSGIFPNSDIQVF